MKCTGCWSEHSHNIWVGGFVKNNYSHVLKFTKFDKTWLGVGASKLARGSNRFVLTWSNERTHGAAHSLPPPYTPNELPVVRKYDIAGRPVAFGFETGTTGFGCNIRADGENSFEIWMFSYFRRLDYFSWKSQKCRDWKTEQRCIQLPLIQ